MHQIILLTKITSHRRPLQDKYKKQLFFYHIGFLFNIKYLTTMFYEHAVVIASHEL